MKLMQISILCIQRCQFRDLDLNNNSNIGHLDKRKIQEASMRFSLLAKKKKFRSNVMLISNIIF